MVPALRALRAHFPEAELHVLVAAEAAPLLEGLPWIDQVWALPRSRGKARLKASLPILRKLRAEHFDRSVDFVGNDRGAILSWVVGARKRIGVRPQNGYRLRRLCYTQTIEELDTTRHECVRDYYVMTPWQVPPPAHWELEIALPKPPTPPASRCINKVVCHLSTSQRKKEWSLPHWIAAAQRLQAAGHDVIFTSGASSREQALLHSLHAQAPEFETLPACESLIEFAYQISEARLFVSPDTAPLHIAAALGVPTLGLFGPTSGERWAPLGARNTYLKGTPCPCSGHLESCAYESQNLGCINSISPERVVNAIEKILKP